MPKRDVLIRSAGPDDLLALLDPYRHLNPDDPVIDPARANERFAAIPTQPGARLRNGLGGESL